MKSLEFFVPGTPVPQDRARAVWTNAGPRHYTPHKTTDYRKLVATVAKAAMKGAPTPQLVPLSLELQFTFTPPASWPTWKRQAAVAGDLAATAKPDLDNLEKAVLDALNGIAWVDDGQVFAVAKSKVYGSQSGARVRITYHNDLLAAQATRRPQG